MLLLSSVENSTNMGVIFDSYLMDFVTFSIILSTIFYYLVRHFQSYWEKRGIASIKPAFLIGNFGRNMFRKISMCEDSEVIYKQCSNEPYVGLYLTLKPIMLINDPALIRTIFIKDFQHFHDRGEFVNTEIDPLSGHLFSMSGDRWKNLRQKLTPVFTSGKLKAMFQTVVDCGKPLQGHMDGVAKDQRIVDVREIAAQYTTNIIASTAFGLEVNCIDNPDIDFRKYGKRAFDISNFNMFKLFLTFSFPALKNYLKVKSTPDDVEKFMMSLVRDTLNYRETNNIVRKDFFQLLIQLKNSGKIHDDDEKWDTGVNKNENMEALTFNELAAQAWVFYVAGFETSSTVISFCLYELAKNPECQKKVQLEIDEFLEKHNGNITYDCVNDMKYLENCIDETLRKYPPVGLLQRECTKEYRIPNTNHIIEKGTLIFIPAYALQRDPRYYPEPEQFKPERFEQENQKNFIEMPFMPFGEGPRICIGSRMGKMQTKVGLILMLQKYSYELAGNTLTKPTFDAKSFITIPAGGIELKVTERIY